MAVTIRDEQPCSFSENVKGQFLIQLLKKRSFAKLFCTRYHTVAPFGIPHRAVKRTTACGYTIPKDTTVILNIYGQHCDPSVWGDPGNFRPERFLSEGDVVPADHPNRVNLYAFGAGTRGCVGEVSSEPCQQVILNYN